MNRRAQGLGILNLIFGLLVFFILWALFFAQWLTFWGQNYITVNSLTGIEAFLAANLNLWVLCGVIFGTLAIIYFGGGD